MKGFSKLHPLDIFDRLPNNPLEPTLPASEKLVGVLPLASTEMGQRSPESSGGCLA